ncbi:ser/Thr protein phosphatase-like protein superfamily [Mollisia scopiformis]|uniref:Ser/Thr protein phosphatase-like protein superfamily n=1 Tax=Mollisia scopiformis TaxID=149040 RepID=A0A194X8A4_MOLSC|nr:ser/Thr protein phosphatase-like protein superfamily [Mollisia scopiformis]KUJ16022.1 ser/Thr protein phosphatase-like protein superfamily [Mollisia scopiformis]
MNKIRSFLSKSSLSAFQILSDLHLEVGQQYTSFVIPPSAPYLILAGDIGRLIDYDSYLAFLAKQAAQFEQVFLVLGNHEFYGLSFLAGLERAQKLENEVVLDGKLVLLHQRRYNTPNSEVTILGCTLWSRVPENAKEVVRGKVKDFEKIEGWTVDDHNASHEADLTWLRHQALEIQLQNKSRVKGERGRNILVVTHHAPSMQDTSSPRNVSNPWSSAFATDLLEDPSWGEVKAWVFGHTHFTTQFVRNGIKILSNQRGYVLLGSRERESVEKDGMRVFDVRRVVHV